VEVPVQYFQSVIAVELAITGALLFQVRYFEAGRVKQSGADAPRDSVLRLLMAVVIGMTLLGSLDGIIEGGGTLTATAVTLGLAVSALPILIRVLPPLVDVDRTDGRRRYSGEATVGLVLYVAAPAAIVLVLNR
jgi:hypothetical protein